MIPYEPVTEKSGRNFRVRAELITLGLKTKHQYTVGREEGEPTHITLSVLDRDIQPVSTLVRLVTKSHVGGSITIDTRDCRTKSNSFKNIGAEHLDRIFVVSVDEAVDGTGASGGSGSGRARNRP